MGAICFDPQGPFCRDVAEKVVENVMFGLDVAGKVIPSVEAGVVAFMTDDMVNTDEVQNLLEVAGLEVACVTLTKLQVDQYDEDVMNEVCYDERVVAVAFECPELEPEWRKRDHYLQSVPTVVS